MRMLAIAASILVAAGCASTHAIRPQVAGADVDFAGAPIVEIRLSSFHFKPDDVRLRAGQPYVLKLVNAGSTDHTFTAPEFFAAAGMAPEDAAKVAKGQIEMGAGATVLLRLVPAAGEYRLVCTEFGHALLGMTGRLIVN